MSLEFKHKENGYEFASKNDVLAKLEDFPLAASTILNQYTESEIERDFAQWFFVNVLRPVAGDDTYHSPEATEEIREYVRSLDISVINNLVGDPHYSLKMRADIAAGYLTICPLTKSENINNPEYSLSLIHI
jgi:hypothetical protein